MQSDPKHRVFVLVAGAGVGKTSIMARLAQRDDVIAYHFCRHDDESRRDPKRMLCSLAYQLAVALPAYRERLNTLPLDMLRGQGITALFTQLFTTPLHGIESPRRVMLIDALDECDHDVRTIWRMCGSSLRECLAILLEPRYSLGSRKDFSFTLKRLRNTFARTRVVI